VVYGKFLPDGFDFTLVVVHLKAYSDPSGFRTNLVDEEGVGGDRKFLGTEA
jgi:hypothetical protein